MKLLALGLVGLVLSGCSRKEIAPPAEPEATVPYAKTAPEKPSPPPVPTASMRWDRQEQTNVITTLSTQIMASVTLEWNNAPTMLPNYHMGVEATTNLTDWYRVYWAPYTSGIVRVTLSNRPPTELYRAFHNW